MIHTLNYDEAMKQLQKELNVCVKMLRDNGIKKAQAEKDYYIRLRQECLNLRAQEIPTTIIRDVVRGVPEVAELRFKRDCAEAVYQGNLEAINSKKLEIRILEGQLSREWGQAKNGL